METRSRYSICKMVYNNADTNAKVGICIYLYVSHHFLPIFRATHCCMSSPFRLMRKVRPPPTRHIKTAARQMISNDGKCREGGGKIEIRTYRECPANSDGADQGDNSTGGTGSEAILHQVFTADDLGFVCGENLCACVLDFFSFSFYFLPKIKIRLADSSHTCCIRIQTVKRPHQAKPSAKRANNRHSHPTDSFLQGPGVY